MIGTGERRVALALASHTNVGKTTLARTLLGRDVGTVRDAPHVTETAERFTLVETAEGDSLELWDTPGFGDSVREVAGYVEPELKVLELTGKPVVVLLNQTGPPRPAQQEAALVSLWSRQFGAYAGVRAVLPLDAFARCWVQEAALLDEVRAALPTGKLTPFERLAAAWRAQREATFAQSMQVLAQRLARAAVDREPVAGEGMRGRLRELGTALGLPASDGGTPRQAAMAALAARLDADIRAGTDRLIALHGLGGSAREQILSRLAEHYAVSERLNEGKAALLGGAIAGALAGLKADIATGGLTLGGGLLLGGVLGALGAAGLARGYNVVRGTEQTEIAWTDEVLDGLVASALLAYLAVAHFGRGRGEWTESEQPAHWQEVVQAVLREQRASFGSIWAERNSRCAEETLFEPLHHGLVQAGRMVLERLYPQPARAVPRSAASA